MIGQLVLVTYMWLQKEKYLVIMGDVVEKAWQKRTTSADYMDAIQISVSLPFERSSNELPILCI